jgi:hypothetical protein
MPMERRSEWEGNDVWLQRQRGELWVGGGLQDGRRQDMDLWIEVVAASVRPCLAVPGFDKSSRDKWADLSSCGPDT